MGRGQKNSETLDRKNLDRLEQTSLLGETGTSHSQTPTVPLHAIIHM